MAHLLLGAAGPRVVSPPLVQASSPAGATTLKQTNKQNTHNSFDFRLFTSLMQVRCRSLSCPHGARCPWLSLGPTSERGALLLLLLPGLRGGASRCEGPDGGLHRWPSVILSWRGR